MEAMISTIGALLHYLMVPDTRHLWLAFGSPLASVWLSSGSPLARLWLAKVTTAPEDERRGGQAA